MSAFFILHMVNVGRFVPHKRKPVGVLGHLSECMEILDNQHQCISSTQHTGNWLGAFTSEHGFIILTGVFCPWIWKSGMRRLSVSFI